MRITLNEDCSRNSQDYPLLCGLHMRIRDVLTVDLKEGLCFACVTLSVSAFSSIPMVHSERTYCFIHSTGNESLAPLNEFVSLAMTNCGVFLYHLTKEGRFTDTPDVRLKDRRINKLPFRRGGQIVPPSFLDSQLQTSYFWSRNYRKLESTEGKTLSRGSTDNKMLLPDLTSLRFLL